MGEYVGGWVDVWLDEELYGWCMWGIDNSMFEFMDESIEEKHKNENIKNV